MLGLINPKAGSSEPLDTVREKFLARGFEGTFVEPTDPDDANRLVRLHRGEVDAIVVGGGDGSIAAILPSVLEAGLPIAVLPYGTANDFARTLDLPKDVDAVCAMLTASHTRRIDVGRIGERYFINTVAGGLPAQAASRLTADLKHKLGMFAAISLIPTLLRTRRATYVTVRGESIEFQAHCTALLIGNGRYTGGVPVRYENMDDGRLHLTICRAQSLPELMSVALSALLGRLPADWNVIERTSPWFEIETARSFDLAVDGDVVARAPARASVLPGALEVFAQQA
ncbi:MAG TPA: diacylglycerol kinase family protein [Verrucomicrobiae bacterium]|nr:diacylglycerol kinase family protein [Verrucomicrobiae bacterium]